MFEVMKCLCYRTKGNIFFFKMYINMHVSYSELYVCCPKPAILKMNFTSRNNSL